MTSILWQVKNGKTSVKVTQSILRFHEDRCIVGGFVRMCDRVYKDRLWKLARCHNYEFVEKENNRVNTRSRPTARTYHLYMVDDIVNNVAGSTDLILNEVNHDTEQINLIAKDFHRVLLRRANNLP